MKEAERGKAVFVRAGALGDFILSLPLLRRLRRQYSELTLVARRRHLDLVLEESLFDHFIDADSAAAAALYTPSLAGGGDGPLSDADLYIFSAHDQALEASLGKFKPRNVFWLNPRPAVAPHAAARFFLAAGLEPPAGLLETPLWNPPLAGTRLWLHPGSGSARKNCPLEFFANVARSWFEDTGEGVTLSFGEADESLAAAAKTVFRVPGMPVELLLSPTLRALKTELAEKAAFYVGNDSGVSHLASALGIPSVVFFLSTDPEVWRPLGRCRCLLWGSHVPARLGYAPMAARPLK